MYIIGSGKDLAKNALVIIFFSESKQLFFCRNDVQALDFLRKGSYAPDKAHFSAL
jgi:hypothetical protein